MKIGFIGCGNMASAMISGMLKKGLYKKDEIIVSNLTEEGSTRSREKLGVVTTLDNHEVVKNTKLVFLAVKPQFYEEVLNEVKGELTPEHTVVGIAPGKTLVWLEEKCGQPLKVVRMMPNTPAQVGEGMTGVCANEKVSAEELARICEITDSFGRTEVVPERLMDAVGAVSGCSPAYVFMFIEAMADAASSVVNYFEDHLIFINIMCNMSVDCDCCAVAEEPCMKDIGILSSTDPVALDQACVDLIIGSDEPGKEHLLERINSRNGLHTIEAAEKLGIGTRDYELISVEGQEN